MCEFTKVINIGNGNSYLYDANINRIALLPEYIHDDNFKFTTKYLRDKEELYGELLRGGFFQGCPLDKIDSPEADKVDDVLDKRMERMILQVTQGCNLACRYCFFSDQYHHKKNSIQMEWEVARKGIDYYIQHAKEMETLNFSFYGGEPLLNFDLIQQCVMYIDRKVSDKSCQYFITTNLTVLNEKIAHFLEVYDFSVLVSLDGPCEIHNKNRKYKDGGNTHEKVLENLNFLRAKHSSLFKKITFNAVLTNQEDYFKIKNFFMDKASLLSENNFMVSTLYLGINEMQFDSVCGEKKTDIRRYVDYLKDNLQKCKELVLSYLLAFDIISVDNQHDEHYADIELVNWIKKFIALYSVKTLPLSEVGHPIGQCIGGGSRLMLDPEGKFWPCEKINTNISELSIGDVDNGIQTDKVKDMLNFSRDNIPCYTCWAFRFCGLCVAVIHNTSRENACSCSKAYFEDRLAQYCNLHYINSNYLSIEKSVEVSYEDICKYLQNKENIDVNRFGYGEDIVENSYVLYKILIIIKFKFGLNFKAVDIIQYKSLKSFLKGICRQYMDSDSKYCV